MAESVTDRLTTQTIGKLTAELRAHYARTPEQFRAFACGFATGQAEKVFLGACRAAMFRPGADHLDWYVVEIQQIAQQYGLTTSVLRIDDPATPCEIWVHRAGFVPEWPAFPPNSAAWHRLRAEACGVPTEEIDLEYHRRSGHGGRCD